MNEEQVYQIAIEFAEYMMIESWEYDFAEQRTHNYREYYADFKQKYPQLFTPSPEQ